ncbi:MAG: cation:proton antiporter, partial [Clostridium sp.]
LALLVFFLVMGFVSGSMSGEQVKIIPILMMIIAPLVIGAFTGIIGVKLLKRESSKKETLLKVVLLIIMTVVIGNYVNNNIISVNLLLSGMAFSAVIANMLDEKRFHEIMEVINPMIGLALIIMMMNLGAPLDYKLILGAGSLTAIYIIVRGVGKIGGAYAGGKISKADDKVCKYLGLALLPHSGVSLLFTGIAATTLLPFVPEYATIIQGTIAAAAVINEIIAVFLAKQAFKMSGEIGMAKENALEDIAT